MNSIQDKNKKASFWKQHIKRWEEEGTSGSAYCRGQGLSRAAFFYWKKKLEGQERSRGFSLIEPEQEELHETRPKTFSGFRVRVTEFEVSSVMELSRFLGSCR